MRWLWRTLVHPWSGLPAINTFHIHRSHRACFKLALLDNSGKPTHYSASFLELLDDIGKGLLPPPTLAVGLSEKAPLL